MKHIPYLINFLEWWTVKTKEWFLFSGITIHCPGSPGHGSRFVENTAAEKLVRISVTYVGFLGCLMDVALVKFDSLYFSAKSWTPFWTSEKRRNKGEAGKHLEIYGQTILINCIIFMVKILFYRLYKVDNLLILKAYWMFILFFCDFLNVPKMAKRLQKKDLISCFAKQTFCLGLD